MISLKFNPVVGHFPSGEKKYAIEWWARWSWYKTQTLHALPLYPVVNFSPWHKGVLASDNSNGIVTHSLSIGIEFWTFNLWLTIGRTNRLNQQ